MIHSTATRTHRHALISSLVLVAAFGASASGQPRERNIIGLSPEAASRLPGVAHLFQVRNASAPPRIVPGQDFKLGEVIARFPLGMSDEEIGQLARLSGAEKVTRISPLGLFLIHGQPSHTATRQLMARLWGTRTVVNMTPNYLGGRLLATFSPNDPLHVSGDQWHIEQPSDIDLDLERAWGEFTRGSSKVVVAATDSGIDVDHPEFADRLFVNPGEIPGNGVDDDGNSYIDDVSGWNTIREDPNNDIDDSDFGHGTYVASLLLANTDNAFQVAGVDHYARLLPLKMSTSASSSAQELQALIAALEYLVVNPDFAQVVNLSVAGYSFNTMLHDELTAAATTHILIGGSGNTGLNSACVGLPNSHPDVITIGATDRTDTIASFSTTGLCVDFVAPGAGMVMASWADPTNPTASHVDDGTSLATPLVTGIASLGLVIFDGLNRVRLYSALKASAVDLGAPGKDDKYGWGRVNAYLALFDLSKVFSDGFESGDASQW